MFRILRESVSPTVSRMTFTIYGFVQDIKTFVSFYYFLLLFPIKLQLNSSVSISSRKMKLECYLDLVYLFLFIKNVLNCIFEFYKSRLKSYNISLVFKINLSR